MKLPKNLKNTEKSAMNRLKVHHGAKPGPTDVTLGRITVLAPQCHPDFIHQGKLPATRQVLKVIPKVANCGLFVSCVPCDNAYDGLFNVGMLFNIYRDTIINPESIGAIIKTIVGFNKASRDGSVLQENNRRKYMET